MNSNLKELKSKPLSERLKEQTLKHLVDQYSLDLLEEAYGIEDVLHQFPDVMTEPDGERGVLTSLEIKEYVRKWDLICPFTDANLKPASYYLSLGNEYALGGSKGRLSDQQGKDELRIPPFQVAIIKTKEIINMPRFLIGRWNIRVSQAYQGLLWVGGPQVDPGWLGYLFCPIYNLSNEDVVLRKGEPIATIDFVRTTHFDIANKGSYTSFGREKARKKLTDYEWRLKSGLLIMAKDRMDDLNAKMKRVEATVSIVFTFIAVLFAALAITVSSNQKSELVVLPIWIYASVGMSIAALITAIYARWAPSTKSWQVIMLIIYTIIAIGFIAIIWFLLNGTTCIIRS